MTRDAEIANFLIKNRCDTSVSWLAADASFRRYGRTSLQGKSCMVMDAPPAHETKTAAFVECARLLNDCGLCTPQVLAADLEQGLLLLEDLGETTLSRLLAQNPQQEGILYRNMYRVLEHLQQQVREAPTTLMAYDSAILRTELAQFRRWYVPAAGIRIDGQGWAMFERLMDEHLRHTEQHPQAMVLRDCHWDNFLFVAGNAGVQQYAILDFQDGGWGSALYDVTSLLFDARREVNPDIQQQILRDHARFLGMAWDDYLPMAAWLVLQRSLKILGIFVRLNARDGKTGYLSHLPRCWRQIDWALSVLPDWQAWFARYLPEPVQSLAVLHADRLDTAMLLAAGKGTRMGESSVQTPKPLLLVAGLPIIEHARRSLIEQGIVRFVINACHLRKQIHLYARDKVDVTVVDERELLETAGGVIHALPRLARDRFWVVNGDCLWRGDPTGLVSVASQFQAILQNIDMKSQYQDLACALLVLSPLSCWRGSDDRVDFYFAEPEADQRIGRLVRAASADGRQRSAQGFGYSGMMLIHRAAYVDYALSTFSHNVVFDDLMARGRLWGMVWEAEYYHIGTPDALARANRVLAVEQEQ